METPTETAAADAPSRYKSLERVLGHGNYRSIATLTGFTATHISRTLRGQTTDVTLSTAAKIAEIAEVSIDDVHYFIQTNKRKKARRAEHLQSALAKRGRLVAAAEATK